MTVIDYPTHCQPHRRLLFHLNDLTHALTPNTHDHQILQFITNLRINPNNPYVLYTSFFPDKDPTTALINLAHQLDPSANNNDEAAQPPYCLPPHEPSPYIQLQHPYTRKLLSLQWHTSFSPLHNLDTFFRKS